MAEQSRIEKIQKLLSLAERAGSQEEADLSYAKAQDLMMKWSIDEAMLAATGKSQDEIVRDEIIIKRSSFFKAYQQLAIAVAQANGVKVLVKNPGTWGQFSGVELFGWKSDIERVKMMYTSLLIQGSRERNRAMPVHVKNDGAKYVARWRNSFTIAYAIHVGNRLREQAIRTKKKAVAEDKSGSLLPAVQTRAERLEAEFKKVPTKNVRATKFNITDADGYNKGRDAADRADIGNERIGGKKAIK